MNVEFRKIAYGVLIVIIILLLFLGVTPLFSPFEASVTIFDNGPPNITSYYPLDLNFSVLGTDSLYFNITYEDPDGQIPDAYWYVDNNFVEKDVGSLFAEFNHEFGCGVSGEHKVKAEVTDGFENDSIQWNISVQFVECPSNGNGNGNGGNGGTGPTPIANFIIDKSLIEIQLTQGQSKIETILVENIGNVNLFFNIGAVGEISPFISLGDQSFTLSPGKLNSITFAFLAEENEPPGVYTGRIDLITGQLNKSINIVLQILEKEALFDLSSELKDDTLTKAQQIEAIITMTDISGLGKVNVLLEYFIKDFSENATKISEETLEVDGTLEIERVFPIPETLKIGEEYVFYVKLTYQNSVATSANVFKVIDVVIIYNFFLWIIVLIIISIFAFWIFYGRKEREKK